MSHSIGCIFAHPDDETFATGGMVARYAAAGVRVDLFVATDGDAGRSSGVPVSSRAELGALRRNELLSAARVLGIEEVDMRGHADGALEQVPSATLIGEVVHFIRRRRPTVLVTFGPEGAPTGHRDHQAISRAATSAFFLAALPTEYPEQLEGGLAPHRASRLYYVAWDEPPPSAELKLHSVAATAAIEIEPWHARKRDAFRAHVTQRDHLGRFETLALIPAEKYALAAGVAQPTEFVDDLFAGL